MESKYFSSVFVRIIVYICINLKSTAYCPLAQRSPTFLALRTGGGERDGSVWLVAKYVCAALICASSWHTCLPLTNGAATRKCCWAHLPAASTAWFWSGCSLLVGRSLGVGDSCPSILKSSKNKWSFDKSQLGVLDITWFIIYIFLPSWKNFTPFAPQNFWSKFLIF